MYTLIPQGEPYKNYLNLLTVRNGCRQIGVNSVTVQDTCRVQCVKGWVCDPMFLQSIKDKRNENQELFGEMKIKNLKKIQKQQELQIKQIWKND
eukprot:TRINITY_DN6541_c0_g1_i16.p2 TRINITY_DN6541_c0_g1~~TRINITY_DN6541_c0_g1_i16.p2  ORF type:complete len:104 (+),score=5.63 TRINITY_DN6541_c0_g1_i16:33-314(+)